MLDPKPASGMYPFVATTKLHFRSDTGSQVLQRYKPKSMRYLLLGNRHQAIGLGILHGLQHTVHNRHVPAYQHGGGGTIWTNHTMAEKKHTYLNHTQKTTALNIYVYMCTHMHICIYVAHSKRKQHCIYMYICAFICIYAYMWAHM